MTDNFVRTTKNRLLAALGTACILIGAPLTVPVSNFAQLAEAAENKADSRDKPIKIGFLTSLTGVASSSAQDMVNGIKLYLDQKKNRMAGHPVSLIVEDDQLQPGVTAEKARKLIEKDKVDLLDGILFAHLAYVLAPIVQKEHLPLVIAVAGSDDLSQRKPYKYAVHISFTSSQPSHPFGEYTYKTLKYRRIATIGMDIAYCWESIGGFQQTFEQNGGKVVQKIWAPLNAKDLTPWIQKIDPTVDAVYVSTVSHAGVLFVDQYRKLGMKPPLIGSGTSFDESILPLMGDNANGIITAMPYSAQLKTPANQQFVEAYQQKYGKLPSWYAEASYTSGLWIDKALQSLDGNTADKEKLLEALNRVKLADAPRGPVELDQYGGPIENIYIRKVEKVNGTYVNSVVATYPKVSQFWHDNPATYLKQPSYAWNYPPCKFCQTESKEP